MQLIEWAHLIDLRLPAHANWLVCAVPSDAETWSRGIFVIGRAQLGRLGGDEFALDCRVGVNVTLARRMPGRRVLKTLAQVLDGAQVERRWASPHVGTAAAVIHTAHGQFLFNRLDTVFAILVWVWGPPLVLKN